MRRDITLARGLLLALLIGFVPAALASERPASAGDPPPPSPFTRPAPTPGGAPSPRVSAGDAGERSLLAAAAPLEPGRRTFGQVERARVWQGTVVQGPLHATPPRQPRPSAPPGARDEPPGGTSSASLAAPEARLAGAAAHERDRFLLKRDTTLELPVDARVGFSRVNEPAVGNLGDTIFQVGNWYAAVSTDNGETFRYIDPDETFPRFPREFSAGVCCDQRVAQHPARDLLFWYLQYNLALVPAGEPPTPGSTPTQSSGTALTNGVRIAVAHGASDLAANRWVFCDYTPASFGFAPGHSLDFPHLQVGANYLYFTSNIDDVATNTRLAAIVARIPLDVLQAGQCVAPEYATYTEFGAIAPASGATTRMLFASVWTASTLAVLDWPESQPTPTLTAVPVAPIAVGPFACPGPDGLDPCSNARVRVMTGWIGPTEVGFLWHAGISAPERPFPFVRVAVLDPANLRVVSQMDIWSRSSAVLYPSLAVNARGHLGGVVYALGGSRFPTVYALMRDDLSSAPPTGGWELHELAVSTSGTPEWGDFTGTVPHARFPHTWIGVAHVISGGSANTNVRPRNFWFMRPRDDPGAPGPAPSPTRTPTVPGTAGPTATPTRTSAPTSTPVPSISCSNVLDAGQVRQVAAPTRKQVPSPEHRSAAPAVATRPPLRHASPAVDARRTARGVPYSDALPKLRPAVGQRPGWTTITCETFEGVDFPGWTTWDNDGADNGEYCWGTVGYQARFGLFALWPAAGCADAVNPATHFYPNNADSWVAFGPFSLADAQDAVVRFSLWHQIARQAEQEDDFLFWGASTDGITFWGVFLTGNSTNIEPPTATGWRDIVFDLTDVPTLGSLLGQPQVWIAWVFRSGAEGVDDGPFIDDVLIEKRTSAPVPVTATPPSAGSASPSATPSPTRPRTPTPLPGGRGFSLSAGAGGVTMTWEPGAGQTGYRVARLSDQGIALLPDGPPLPGTATGFVDPTPATGPACYAVVPLAGPAQTPTGLSDVLCVVIGARSPLGAPQSVSLRLGESNAASLHWQPPPGGGQEGYLLLPLGRPPIGLGADATAATDLIQRPTCYVLFVRTAGALGGNSEIFCAIPRVPELSPLRERSRPGPGFGRHGLDSEHHRA